MDEVNMFTLIISTHSEYIYINYFDKLRIYLHYLMF